MRWVTGIDRHDVHAVRVRIEPEIQSAYWTAVRDVCVRDRFERKADDFSLAGWTPPGHERRDCTELATTEQAAFV